MRYLLLALFLTITPIANADIFESTPQAIKAVTQPSSWIQDRALKYGLLTSFIVAQGATGLIESAKFSGIHISNSADDYHIYRFVQDVAWVSTGFFTYATIEQKNKPWWAKTSRIISAACYARDANELIYRWNRTGSPFCYSDRYSSNKKAVVMIKWDSTKGKFVDFYIPGTGKQGALIDAGFAIAGFLFGRIGDIR